MTSPPGEYCLIIVDVTASSRNPWCDAKRSPVVEERFQWEFRGSANPATYARFTPAINPDNVSQLSYTTTFIFIPQLIIYILFNLWV